MSGGSNGRAEPGPANWKLGRQMEGHGHGQISRNPEVTSDSSQLAGIVLRRAG